VSLFWPGAPSHPCGAQGPGCCRLLPHPHRARQQHDPAAAGESGSVRDVVTQSGMQCTQFASILCLPLAAGLDLRWIILSISMEHPGLLDQAE